MQDCTYKNFNRNNLTNLKPTQQVIVPKPGQPAIPPAWMIPLQYNYGTEENPYFSDFEMVLCEFTSPVGITKRETVNDAGEKRVDESIMVKFDPANVQHTVQLEVLQDIYMRGAELIGGVKGIVKKHNFNADKPDTDVYKPLVYFPKDEATGEFIPGRLGSMFLKLFSRGSGVMLDQTLFVDLKNRPIDRKLLMGVELKFIPKISVKKIRVAAGISFQIETKEVIVTSIKARNTESTMFSTLAELREQRPELETQLDQQLAKLQMDRQDKLLPPITPPSKVEPEPQVEPEQEVTPVQPAVLSTVPDNIATAVNKAPRRKEYKIPLDN